MTAWIVPALKAVLPHVGTILSVALPVFTKKTATSAADPASVQQQQIAELQTAASQNAANIRELAEQLQSTVSVLEQAVTSAASSYRRALLVCVITAVASLAAFGAAVYLLATR